MRLEYIWWLDYPPLLQSLRLIAIIKVCNMQEKEKDTSKVTYCFIVFALLWEIAVGIIYGLFIGYNETVFQSMEGVQSTYPFSETSSQSSSYLVSSSQFPYPVAVVAIAIILLIVGNCGLT